MSARLRDIDFVGAILQMGFLVSGVMAINFGGTLYAWASGQTIALFVVSAILLVAFVVQQKFSFFTKAENRMFPVHFLKMKEPVLLFILMAAANTCGMMMMYYIPLYFQFTRGAGSLSSGVRLLPLIFTVTAAIMVNGAALSKTGYYQPWYLGGSILILIGGVLICKA
jgi:MFS family permease